MVHIGVEARIKFVANVRAVWAVVGRCGLRGIETLNVCISRRGTCVHILITELSLVAMLELVDALVGNRFVLCCGCAISACIVERS